MNGVPMHKQNRRATDAGGRETARNLGNGLTTTRSYLADNQIQNIDTLTVETLTYPYNTKGNMTTDDRGCGMTWDYDNMLQSFAGSGVPEIKNATYESDAIGRRVAKSIQINHTRTITSTDKIGTAD
ncbi:MAG: hypothetical protein JNM43_28805 [Planctomycetaceae bacterium]|nr:hypothetical protein [Planctomycetaceae bacterium]